MAGRSETWLRDGTTKTVPLNSQEKTAYSAAPMAIQTTSRVPTSQAAFCRVDEVDGEGDQKADDHEDEAEDKGGLIHREIEGAQRSGCRRRT